MDYNLQQQTFIWQTTFTCCTGGATENLLFAGCFGWHARDFNNKLQINERAARFVLGVCYEAAALVCYLIFLGDKHALEKYRHIATVKFNTVKKLQSGYRCD